MSSKKIKFEELNNEIDELVDVMTLELVKLRYQNNVLCTHEFLELLNYAQSIKEVNAKLLKCCSFDESTQKTCHE